MSESEPIRILYMEDDAGLARLLQRRLERAGYVVTLARDGAEGLALYDAGSYDIVAVDQNMPIHDGLEVIRTLTLRGPLPPVIMVTGSGDEKVAAEAIKMGAGDYIVKDLDGGYLELLPSVIEQVLSQHRLVEEKWRAEEALRQYAAELEARNEELDAFAHTVAHDLKNPLSNVVGHSETLVEYYVTLSDKERLRSLRSIVKSAHRMDRIIDELLLLSEVRKAEVELEPLEMASIVVEAEQRLTDMIEETRAEIVEPSPLAWPAALGYAPWVEEVWVNYLSNALKYGGQPPLIELGATIEPGKVRFWMRDNGAGIAPEDQARLFTPFTRLDQVRAKGHGLGLSIVRRIVEKLGGQVGVESQIGKGSVFSFTLTVVPAPTTVANPETRRPQ